MRTFTLPVQEEPSTPEVIFGAPELRVVAIVRHVAQDHGVERVRRGVAALGRRPVALGHGDLDHLRRAHRQVHLFRFRNHLRGGIHQAGALLLGLGRALFARRAPGRILFGHAADQIADLSFNLRLPRGLVPGLPPPIQLEALAMPCDHRLGLNEHKTTAPVPPQPRKPDPEDPVTLMQRRSLHGSL